MELSNPLWVEIVMITLVGLFAIGFLLGFIMKSQIDIGQKRRFYQVIPFNKVLDRIPLLFMNISIGGFMFMFFALLIVLPRHHVQEVEVAYDMTEIQGWKEPVGKGQSGRTMTFFITYEKDGETYQGYVKRVGHKEVTLYNANGVELHPIHS